METLSLHVASSVHLEIIDLGATQVRGREASAVRIVKESHSALLERVVGTYDHAAILVIVADLRVVTRASGTFTIPAIAAARVVVLAKADHGILSAPPR